MYEAIGLGIVLLNIAITLWNAWQNMSIKLAITEMQLNLRREFNGRYVIIDRFEDLRDRIKIIEEAAKHES